MPARPSRPVRNASLRAALYVRVSSEEQVEGYSLDAQTRALRAHCQAQGWEIAQEYRDEGKSARTHDLAKRPAFAALLAEAEAGAFDVILVHKLDRFARNIVVALTTLERLGASGVGFVSLSEQIDFTTPSGRMFLAMLASFARFYSDNLSTETRKGKAERKAQGMYNGVLPFGARKGEQGIPEPDPATHPGLLLAFALAADGRGDRDVAVALNAAGYRTTGNHGPHPWTKDSARRVLINRLYLGELPDGQGGWLPGKHAPMLDATLFAAAQATRALNTRTRRTRAGNAARRRGSLTGLAHCGRCGGPIHLFHGRGGRPWLRCYGRNQGNGCPQSAIPLATIDAQLTDYLAGFRVPDDYRAQIDGLLREADTGEDSDERRRRELTARLGRIGERFEWGDIDAADYRAKRAEIERELATLRPAAERAAWLEGAAALLREIGPNWAAGDGPERNEIAASLFERVTIVDDQIAEAVIAPEMAPFFALDSGDDASPRPGSGR